jgi:hypothetical protein
LCNGQDRALEIENKLLEMGDMGACGLKMVNNARKTGARKYKQSVIDKSGHSQSKNQWVLSKMVASS